MRLTSLEPRWLGDPGAPPGAKQGVSFICPCCREPKRRLGVWFANPICGNAAVDPKADWLRRATEGGHLSNHHMGEIAWQRTGETFETLTLSPSVDCSRFGHWHGFITNGEAS